jgi:stage V sporulation protein SpoVS
MPPFTPPRGKNPTIPIVGPFMKLESNQGIKILQVIPGADSGYESIWSCNGGNFQWDPPIQNEDGSYTPGSWTPSVKPHLCSRGYHLTNPEGISFWWSCKNLRAFLVEYKGDVDGSFEDSRELKIAVESCRILRPLTSEELAAHSIFLGGIHKVDWRNAGRAAYATSGAIIYADEGVEIQAYGDAEVNAYGHAQVFARGRVVVHAYDFSRVDAYDDAMVIAHENSNVYYKSTVKVEAKLGHTGSIVRR